MPKQISRYALMRLAALTLLIAVATSGCALFSSREGTLSPVSTVEGRTHTTLRARATVSLKSPEKNGLKGKAVILAKRPASFRVQVLGPFGQTVAVLASDGEGLYIYSKGESTYRRTGDPLYPFTFMPGEFVAFLLGGVGEEGTDILPGYEALRDDNGNISTLSRKIDGKELYIRLADYRGVGETAFPYSLSIENGLESILIRYQSVELDTDLGDSLFVLQSKGTAEEGPGGQ